MVTDRFDDKFLASDFVFETNKNKISESHEFNLAFKMNGAAKSLAQTLDQEKTSAQVGNNKIFTALINNQLQFYRKDYDRIQNLVPNGYRA